MLVKKERKKKQKNRKKKKKDSLGFDVAHRVSVCRVLPKIITSYADLGDLSLGF